MHWFDLAVGATLVVGAVWSLFGGLSRVVLSTFGILTAFVLAMWGYTAVAAPFGRLFATGWPRQAAGIAFMCGTTAGLYLIWYLVLRGRGQSTVSTPLERLGGGVFGVIWAGVLLTVLFLTTMLFLPRLTTRLTANARSTPALYVTARTLSMLLPMHTTATLQQAGQHHPGQAAPRHPPALAIPQPAQPVAPPRAGSTPASGISENDARALERLLRERLQEQ